MKKLLACILVLSLFICCGCQKSGGLGGSDVETGNSNNTLNEICTHPESELGGQPKYVQGEHCDDPVEIFLTCQLCGEEVLNGTIESEFKCVVPSGKGTVILEPTCTAVGRAEGTCGKCGKEMTWDLSMLDHHYRWFYGDEVPSCIGCGLALESCAHEYEMKNDQIYTKSEPGRRYYQCVHCEDSYTVYYDEFGDYDLQAVVDAVCTDAEKYGWVVVLDYNLQYGNEIGYLHNYFDYKLTDSKEATQLLTDKGLAQLEQMNQSFYSPENNRSIYYLTVVVDCGGNVGMGTWFYVDTYVRIAD